MFRFEHVIGKCTRGNNGGLSQPSLFAIISYQYNPILWTNNDIETIIIIIIENNAYN